MPLVVVDRLGRPSRSGPHYCFARSATRCRIPEPTVVAPLPIDPSSSLVARPPGLTTLPLGADRESSRRRRKSRLSIRPGEPAALAQQLKATARWTAVAQPSSSPLVFEA
jgi:hypothetical protein